MKSLITDYSPSLDRMMMHDLTLAETHERDVLITTRAKILDTQAAAIPIYSGMDKVRMHYIAKLNKDHKDQETKRKKAECLNSLLGC